MINQEMGGGNKTDLSFFPLRHRKIWLINTSGTIHLILTG
ncbi:hypothetical protein JOD24_002449 [Kroppenstedtia sanguinis]